MTNNNWIKDFREIYTKDGNVKDIVSALDMERYITTLLEKQREEIEQRLRKSIEDDSVLAHVCHSNQEDIDKEIINIIWLE